MSDRSIQVCCPCCDNVLEIDVRTQTVLRHAPRERLDETGKIVVDPERWVSANEKVRGRKDKATDAFDAALNKERSRSRDLDDLFDKAKGKIDRRKSGGDDPF